ncbi:putative eukaryotic translation initiation factor 3 subunit A-like isoform X4 [Apostichopus japonicus]|uniref:Putative eukaryotic translation initiation factor 3 subunit A-like isoform X4 n=1 Tax=Stichopus japonicus TaxID=307972 RepID=A0A2G8JM89_STIJA|nr:putative eukaryotic translation initiation factor 3 subunit A-like isoform X4 [Apostichopus japonicus]
MSLLKEMDALKEELAKKDVVQEKVTVEEMKKQGIRKEEIKKEEVKEQIKESEGEMTDKTGDEEDDDDDDEEDEECAVYTLDDLEDGLEEADEEEENVVEETEKEEEEVKNSSRISFAEPASTDTSRVEVDATPLMKRKKQKATKSRKRKSADLLEEDDDHKKKKKFKEVVAPRRQTRGMSRAKRAKTVPVRFEEQENIPEEGTSPGAISTTSTDSSVRRGALSKLGGMLQNSPLGRSAKKLVGSTTTSPAPKPPSPPKVVQVQAEGKRRKRKLFKTDISAPFECSPFETVSIGDAKTVVDSNQRVTRSLRSRIKKNTNN